MSTGTYVTRRSGSANFYARIVVPDDVRKAVGRAEIWQSLKTPVKKEAQRRSQPIFAKHFAHFEALRRTRAATEDDLHEAAFEHYGTLIEYDRRSRMPLPADAGARVTKIISAELDAADAAQPSHVPKRSKNEWQYDDPAPRDQTHAAHKKRRALLREVRKNELAIGDLRSVEWAADFFIAREQLDIKRGSAAYIDLCQRLLRAELEALKRAEERDGGEWGGMPSDLAVRPSRASQKPIAAKPGESILELFAIFKSEKRASKSDDTWDMNEKIVRLFVSFIGERSHVTAITRTAIRDWKIALDQWPIKAAGTNEFAGLGFKEIVRKNQSLSSPKPRISDRTKNKYLSAMGSFCTWLLVNEHIPNDVMKGMSIAEGKGRKKIRPFSDDQLAAIFASPLYAGCERDDREHLPGTHKIGDWRRWLPFIALFTGARQAEICQLLTADVRKLNEVWVFHITTEGEGDKRTKTSGSQRVVPMHPTLIELGFLDFHAARVAAKEPRLFPELTRDRRTQFGAASKFFNSYFRRIGVKEDKSVNFHSFRHGIADAFRRAGYRDEEFAPLLGHVKGTTTARYGLLREGELSALSKMINAVEFPSLTFLHRLSN